MNGLLEGTIRNSLEFIGTQILLFNVSVTPAHCLHADPVQWYPNKVGTPKQLVAVKSAAVAVMQVTGETPALHIVGVPLIFMIVGLVHYSVDNCSHLVYFTQTGFAGVVTASQ
jgi:hypothetical protein